MLIFDEYNKPVIIDNLYGPVLTEYIWVLDLPSLDFTLAPLTMLEETVCPSIQLRIGGADIILPANWNILVYDRDTTQLDVIPVSDTAGREFTALIYGPTRARFSPATITVTNYFIEYKNVGPSLNKQQMLCHPIGPNDWIVVSASDGYNKYLKDNIVGDLIT